MYTNLKKRLAPLVALVFAMGLFTTAASRGEQAPEGAPVDATPKASTMQVSSLAEKDIQGQFDSKGERYHFLFNIGKTIDNARNKRDAETLALTSILLFRAEQMSGKKSVDVTASGLLDESTRLAESQKNGPALKVVAHIWGDASFRPGNAARSRELMDKAKVFEAEKQSAKRGSCRLVVKNQTSHTVDLYADNQYLGSIEPRDTRYVYVENGHSELFGHANCHNIDWGPSHYRLGHDFTWRLTQ